MGARHGVRSKVEAYFFLSNKCVKMSSLIKMLAGLRFTADYRTKVRKATVTSRTKGAAAVKGFIAFLQRDALKESTL